MHDLLYLHWNPDRIAFYIPYFHHPIAWYGLFFVFGFMVAYFIMLKLVQSKLNETKENALFIVDRLTWFVIAGTIVGARLGHVFFYDFPRYKEHPLQILEIWKGGLASHGGAIGVLIALFFYTLYIKKKFPKIHFLTILDLIVIPTAFVGFCIRIGNFFNQEILGTVSQLPWAVVFEDPMERATLVPRHPVQLYEALAYLVTFFILYALSRSKRNPGFLSGLFFILVFTSRFFLEFLKLPQSAMIDESVIQTGQLLSLPFIFGGIYLMFNSRNFGWDKQQ